MKIIDDIARSNAFIQIRRDIHAHPELGYEEKRTSDLVAQKLEEWGIEVHRGIATTGVVGTLKRGSGDRVIGLRADMDALPIHEQTGLAFASKVTGKMHACGHDAHTVIALGAAAALSELRDSLAGRIKFIFQPAEETLSGARAMIADGVLDAPKLDLILGYHNWPAVAAGKVGYNAGAVMSAADAFDVTLKGRDGHGAHPHLAIDALAAAAHFVSQVQTVVSREVKPVSPAVLTIGELHAGRARNIIAGTAELKGIVRTLEPGLSEKIEAAVRRMLEGLKAGMRVDYTLDWRRMAPPLHNDAAILQPVLESARQAIGEENVLQLPEPSMGSEDFAWFAEKVPAAHLRIGSKIDGLDTAIHRSNYDCNEKAIDVGVRVLTRAALDLSRPNSGTEP
jgi:amidohydrolase